MTTVKQLPLLVLADDLSGATEVAALLSRAGLRTRVELSDLEKIGQGAPEAGDHDAVVIDIDIRDRTSDEISAHLSADIASEAGYRCLMMKLDSQLRHPFGAVVRSLVQSGGRAFVSSAVPAIGRIVVDDRVSIHGRSLGESSTWLAHAASPPASVTAAVGNLPSTHVGLTEIRQRRLSRVPKGTAEAVLCDAATDADLDVLATSALSAGAILVGAGGLAAALGRALSASRAEPTVSAGNVESRLHPLVVVGTAEPAAVSQIKALVGNGAQHIAAAPADLLGTASPLDAHAIGDLLREGPVVVSIGRDAGVRLDDGPALTAALARVISRVESSSGTLDLVLTGGATARQVMANLGITRCEPLAEPQYGAVILRAGQRLVATKPGSYGDAGSLLSMTTEISRHRSSMQRLSADLHTLEPVKGHDMATSAIHSSPSSLPLIAVTMGDGAGVGPEVTVAAVLDSDIAGVCRPVVVGDAQRLDEAARILGLDATVARISSVHDAEFTPGRVNVIDLGLLPHDLAWGELSAVAGDAAFQYIRVAAELADSGDVQAICTAPLNKAALHAGGHRYPGHTEMLADLTGTEEVSMMLSTPKVKVIHVTTHIGLIDAVAKIEPGLVERTTRRGHTAMLQSGIKNPKIGVCAINPHAGENGLFGYGEEAEKIEPAIRALQADGIDAQGPLPADTAFFLAGRGDYDLIVAMYHDQGHGPVKVLGIDTGVNITVGLPVIRTSVDHGTAFDIAGTGVVDTRSMVEALRQAAQLAPKPVTV